MNLTRGRTCGEDFGTVNGRARAQQFAAEMVIVREVMVFRDGAYVGP